MSRYSFKPDQHTTVTVGWDNPLQTLFGDVEHVSQEEPIISTMIGNACFDLKDICMLESLIGWNIPTDTRNMLEADMGNATEPTPLQQHVKRMMDTA